MYMKERETEKT